MTLAPSPVPMVLQALEDEIDSLKHSVTNLELRLDHVEAEQRRLTSIKKELEVDLKVCGFVRARVCVCGCACVCACVCVCVCVPVA